VTKSKRIIQERDVEQAGERRESCRVLVRNVRERGHLKDLGEDGKILLK
jgi:hypothetical protein